MASSHRSTASAFPTGQLLWRLHGPARVVAAVLYPHADGAELRVFFEPEHRNDLLSAQTGSDVRVLEERAERLKAALQEQGWVELAVVDPGGVPASPARRVARGAAWVGALGLGAWMWRRARRRRKPRPSSEDV